MKLLSAVTISLVPEARGGPFVFWDDFAAACGKAAALGFDAVELFPRSVDALDVETIRRVLDAHKLRLAAVGTGAGWVVHKLRLTDCDPGTRQRARDFVASVIDFAGRLGAPAIIGSMQGRYETTREEALGWLANALEQLAPRAESHQQPILIEPLNRYETNLLNSVGDGLAFLGRLKAQNVKLLCDLFHMNIEEASIGDALRAADAHVGHVHFADSNRRAVGFGHMEVAPVMDALDDIGYAGYLSAEILPLPDGETAARQTIHAFKQAVGSP